MYRAEQPAAASPRAETAPARWPFALATLLTPVVLLLALEGALRLAGFGESFPLFVPAPGKPGYLQANRYVAKRFVSDQSKHPVGAIDTTYFTETKRPGSVRIFVQGGSTAAGFPYLRWGSLAGMLTHRLQHTFLDREIDVISTAMAAVNSYTLLDFVDEILAQQPDAILVYAGHNEYLGVLGVGSTLSSGSGRYLTWAFLQLRDLRLFQLLQRLHQGARTLLCGESPEGEEESGTLMSRIAREQEIALDSELYRRGLEQFRGNLAELLAAYRRAGVPVLIGTVASNERDQRPFVSALAPDTDATAWRAQYERGTAALARGDLVEAEAALAEALRLDDGSADAHYARGQILEAEGRYAEARQAYLAAKDRDQLRFRAPEAINHAIRELAREYGAILVDVEQAFVDASPHGIVGSELMLEHLHPNARGYFLLADAFYDAMREQGLIGPWDHAVPEDTAWRRQPITEVDRIAGEHRLAHLKADWPFQPGPTAVNLPPPQTRAEQIALELVEKKLSWTGAMRELLAFYKEGRDFEGGAQVALNLARVFPFSSSMQTQAGRLLIRLERNSEALYYLERAVELAPENQDDLLALGRALAISGRPGRARETLERLLELAPGHPRAIRLLADLREE